MNLRLSLLRGGWRQSLFLLAAASLLALCAAIGELQSIHEESEWRIIAFFLLLPIGLAVTFTWPRTGTPSVQAAGVLLLALVARLALFPNPVDSDVYRYLWEGRLVREGYDPYAHIASASGSRVIALALCAALLVLGATVVLSEPGRGRQIAAGVAKAGADVVLVLHADSEIAPDTAHRVLAALNARPQAVGGAVGQRFDLGTPNLCIIECLNEVKSVLLGLSFGDQGQFFRRAPIIASGGFPNLPLMEDVELSLRLRVAGPMLYLGGGLVCSARRWWKVNWLKCCITVVALTAIYRLRRREGAKIADILYRRYYSTAALNAERYSAYRG